MVEEAEHQDYADDDNDSKSKCVNIYQEAERLSARPFIEGGYDSNDLFHGEKTAGDCARACATS